MYEHDQYWIRDGDDIMRRLECTMSKTQATGLRQLNHVYCMAYRPEKETGSLPGNAMSQSVFLSMFKNHGYISFSYRNSVQGASLLVRWIFLQLLD
jgi:hypothetical protein